LAGLTWDGSAGAFARPAAWDSRIEPYPIAEQRDFVRGDENMRRVKVALVVLSAAFLMDSPVLAQEPLVIAKVEPPNWFHGMKISKIEVMLTGQGLEGTSVSANNPGLTVGRTSSFNSHYVFFDLEVAPDLAAGSYALIVTNPAGESRRIDFAIKEKLPPKGRFLGIDANQIIYQIITDRFANHSPPPEKAGSVPKEIDRTDPRGRHGGNLSGIVDHLDYLQELGITAIWLSPLYANGKHPTYGTGFHGYWANDHYKIDTNIGDIKSYRFFMDQAHLRRIRVVQDQVLNHVAVDHRWKNDPPTPTWFHGSPQRHLEQKYDITALIDPHSIGLRRKSTLEGWFGGDLPDLNQEDPHVEMYLIQNSLWWIAESGIDGIRLDAYPYVSVSFWSRWHAAIHLEFPTVNSIGEITAEFPHELASFQGPNRKDSIDIGIQYLIDFPLARTIRAVLEKDVDMQTIPKLLEQDHLYRDPSKLMTFLGNHDDFPRLATVVQENSAKIKLAYAMLLTVRGIPILYAGDEVGLIGAADPWNRRDFPGGFSDDRHSVFEPKRRSARESDLIESVREGIRLRKQCEALSRGELITLSSDRDFWLFLRRTPGEAILVALSKSVGPQNISLRVPDELTGVSRLSPLMSLTPEAKLTEKLEFTMPGGCSAAVWRIVYAR
jgi:neopullulanase